MGVSGTRVRLRIRRTVLVDKFPLTLYQQCLEVFVGIRGTVVSCTIANFQIHNNSAGFVDQVMAIAGACLETRAHAWRKPGRALVRMQCGMTLQDVDELVLPGVRMPQ